MAKKLTSNELYAKAAKIRKELDAKNRKAVDAVNAMAYELECRAARASNEEQLVRDIQFVADEAVVTAEIYAALRNFKSGAAAERILGYVAERLGVSVATEGVKESVNLLRTRVAVLEAVKAATWDGLVGRFVGQGLPMQLPKVW